VLEEKNIMNVRHTSRAFVAVTAALVLLGGSTAALAQAKSDATIAFDIFKAGFIVGGSGGSGTLTYKGKSYPLNIGGVSLGATIGVTKAELLGEVYNLKSVNDITGTYTVAQAGFAVAGGNKVADLRNSKGVQIKVRGKQVGLALEADLSGLQIELKK
jgi:lipid-binding SYLF domain-containing protein